MNSRMRYEKERDLLGKYVVKEEADVVLDLSMRSSFPLQRVGDFDDDCVRHQENFSKKNHHFSDIDGHICQLEVELKRFDPPLPKALESFPNLKTLHLYIFDTGKRLPEFNLKLDKLEWIEIYLYGEVTLPFYFDSFPELGIIVIHNLNKKTTLVQFQDSERLWELHNLNSLTIINVELAPISESLGNFKELLFLTLWDNNLKTLPETIVNLPSLRTLNLRGNSLDDKSLKYLEILKEKGVYVH